MKIIQGKLKTVEQITMQETGKVTQNVSPRLNASSLLSHQSFTPKKEIIPSRGVIHPFSLVNRLAFRY